MGGGNSATGSEYYCVIGSLGVSILYRANVCDNPAFHPPTSFCFDFSHVFNWETTSLVIYFIFCDFSLYFHYFLSKGCKVVAEALNRTQQT